MPTQPGTATVQKILSRRQHAQDMDCIDVGGENMMVEKYLLIACICSITAIIASFIVVVIKFIHIKKKYGPVTDAELAAQSILDKAKNEYNNIENNILKLKHEYLEKKNIYDKVYNEVEKLNNFIGNSEICLYDYEFAFNDSDKYKEAIEINRHKQKAMVHDKAAVICDTKWTVGGSVKSGNKMISEAIKTTLRAFNSECDMIISRLSWKNYNQSKEKINKSFSFYNSYNKTLNVEINADYLNLKLEELRFVFEEQEKRQQEKEKQREIKERIRDEERLEKDRIAAEKEEEKYQRLLDKAKIEISKATGQKVKDLEEEIAQLTETLAIAKEKAQRAISMAQQTKSGYVYVISNIGSFGDDVFKIGMTRRLEPYDRVRELGDASVPFEFDVHAMIACDDAPALEKKLHSILEQYKMNLINNRREFFKAPVSVIENEVKKEIPGSIFTKQVEAEQYNKSIAIRLKNEHSSDEKSVVKEVFPDSI